MTSLIKSNLVAVKQTIADYTKQYHRADASVTLLAVSKTFPESVIMEAFSAGQRCFAENYVDEALAKIQALADYAIEWHFIGAIQSNKTRLIAEHFDWVHTLAREKVATRLHQQRPPTAAALNVCIQVNIDHESSKSGVKPESVLALAEQIQALDRLCLRGLMAIPQASDDVNQQFDSFKRLAELYATVQQQGYALDTLSMGMSADYAMAIKAGSTMVRLGTAIFGKR